MKSVPFVDCLHVRNYRTLQDFKIEKFSPLTVFVGPNGSGKSTVSDVFAFIAECFSSGLVKACEKRGGLNEMRSRGMQSCIVFELKYRENIHIPAITYHLSIDEHEQGPYVEKEFLEWRPESGAAPCRFLDFSRGAGKVVPGEFPANHAQAIEEQFDSEAILAVNTLGHFAKHPRINLLRRFVSDWHLFRLRADPHRMTLEAKPQKRLCVHGDNLANVILYFRENHPEKLDFIFSVLSGRIPHWEGADARIKTDGRLHLCMKDAPFDRFIPARFASEGTLKMLSYLTILFHPDPPRLTGLEEPENHLHARFLPALAEDCRRAAEDSQVFVTTHSPYFVDGLKPEEVWVLNRDKSGFTGARQASEIPGIRAFMEEGANLGQLWAEGFFDDAY